MRNRLRGLFGGLLIIQLGLLSSPSVRAAEPPVRKAPNPIDEINSEEKVIPKKPTAPPALMRRIPVEIYQCKREFVYKGKTLNCDSRLYTDGENLRPIIKSVPGAIDELNQYQRNRRRVEILAYTGSGGLALMLASLIVRGDRGLTNALFFGGVGLLGSSALYGMSLLRENETHLGSAIQKYNESKPADPIELKFSTGFAF